jgi:hypothetical protein
MPLQHDTPTCISLEAKVLSTAPKLQPRELDIDYFNVATENTRMEPVDYASYLSMKMPSTFWREDLLMKFDTYKILWKGYLFLMGIPLGPAQILSWIGIKQILKQRD